MTEPGTDATIKSAAALLDRYGFEQDQPDDLLLDRWLRAYTPRWVRLALIESLYLGRYKAISVEQILLLWARRGHVTYHFSHEFEALVCNNLPRNLALSPPVKGVTSNPARLEVGTATEAPVPSPPSLVTEIRQQEPPVVTRTVIGFKDYDRRQPALAANGHTETSTVPSTAPATGGQPAGSNAVDLADGHVGFEEPQEYPQLPREAFAVRLAPPTDSYTTPAPPQRRAAEETSPIQQFQPQSVSSGTYQRLRALAYARGSQRSAPRAPDR